jgi:PAS domain S-box-containing protein
VRPGSTIPPEWFPAREVRTRGFDGSLVKPTKLLKRQTQIDVEGDSLPANFRRMERREWWLWGMAFTVTLLVTLGLSSFVLPARHLAEDLFSFFILRQAVRGLVGLVLLFDVYTIYQQLQIHRIRRELLQREELFRLINENAADMIAIVDMEGRRIYNSMACQKILGYTPEELKSSSGIEQIHPDDRDHVKRAAEEARKTGIGRPLEYRIRHKDGSWRALESTSRKPARQTHYRESRHLRSQTRVGSAASFRGQFQVGHRKRTIRHLSRKCCWKISQG